MIANVADVDQRSTSRSLCPSCGGRLLRPEGVCWAARATAPSLHTGGRWRHPCGAPTAAGSVLLGLRAALDFEHLLEGDDRLYDVLLALSRDLVRADELRRGR